MRKFSREWWFHSEPCTGIEIGGEYSSMTIPPALVLVLGLVSVVLVVGLLLCELTK